MSDLEDKLRKIVSDRLDVPPDKITNESRWVEDLKADSLDVIELIMMFEETFGYEIPEDAAESMETFGQALEYLRNMSNA